MKKSEEEKIKERNDKIIKYVDSILSKFYNFHGEITIVFRDGGPCFFKMSSGQKGDGVDI